MTAPRAGSVLLVGCGKMGGALLRGWLAAGQGAGAAERFLVVEPEPMAVPDDPAVVHAASVDGLPLEANPDVLVLAVKPQVLDAAAAACRPLVGPGSLVLSVAAGKTMARLEALLGEQAAVVRAMPNTPAAIGRGVSVLVANRHVTPAQRGLAEALMRAAGAVEWIEDEALMDAVTAVSGSGPAYVFLLIEALAEAGTAAGLPADLAMRLARGTVAGAGALAEASAEPAAALRRNVTSPGGTTAAALAVLMAEDGLRPLLARAVEAAARRSRELAGAG